jgi:hypothetical protein
MAASILAAMSDVHLYVQNDRGPAVRILRAAGALALITGIVAAVHWFTAEPQAAKGRILRAFAVEQSGGRRVIAGIEVELEDLLGRELVVQEVEVRLTTRDNTLTDFAAPIFEHPRYLAAFPSLRLSEAPPLAAESRIPDHARVSGLIIVGFPVSAGQFAERESLTVILRFYGHRPLTLVTGGDQK